MPKKKGELSIEERLEQSIVAKEEEPYKLPSNWIWTRLGDICNYIQRGKSPKYVDFSPIFVISQKCVQWNGFDLTKARYTSEETKYTEERFLLPNDILWNSTGTGTVGRLCILKDDIANQKMVADSHVTVVRTSKSLLPQCIHKYLISNTVQSNLDSMTTGSTNQKELNLTSVKNLIIPLPPLEEQKRIVEKLDSLFEKIQKIKEIIEEVKEKTTSRREAILSKAFSGELTEKWRGENHTENARELLVKINDEKLKLWEDECKKAEDEGRKKPAKPKLKTIDEMLVGAEEMPYKLPSNWVWTRLGDITDILNGDRGKNYPSKDKLLENGEIPFISAVNLEDGQILKENLLFLSNEQYEKLRAGKLRENDLLFCIRGSLGKFGKNYFSQGAIASSLVIVRNILKNKETINFIENYFRTLLLKNEIAKYNNGTAQPNLSAENFKKFLLPLPPLEEQKEIVRVLDRVFEEENRISELISLENKIEILEKTILDRAFRGELGTGNSDDEPAIELLKKCLEER